MCFPTNNPPPAQPALAVAAITAKTMSNNSTATSPRRGRRSVSFASTTEELQQVFRVPVLELSFYQAQDYQRFRFEAWQEQQQQEVAQQIHRQTQYTEKRRERRRQKAAEAAAFSSSTSTPPPRRRMPPRRCLNNMRNHMQRQQPLKQ